MRQAYLRTKIWIMTAVAGGAVAVLNGCDPTVRDGVLSGVESATTTLFSTFIGAFFETVLAPDDEGEPTVVRAIREYAPQIFA